MDCPPSDISISTANLRSIKAVCAFTFSVLMLCSPMTANPSLSRSTTRPPLKLERPLTTLLRRIASKIRSSWWGLLRKIRGKIFKGPRNLLKSGWKLAGEIFSKERNERKWLKRQGISGIKLKKILWEVSKKYSHLTTHK